MRFKFQDSPRRRTNDIHSTRCRGASMPAIRSLGGGWYAPFDAEADLSRRRGETMFSPVDSDVRPFDAKSGSSRVT